jgi:hypothetical protein
MKTASQKLKKLKTKQVYGFKKDNFNNIVNGVEPTLTTLTGTGVVYNP